MPLATPLMAGPGAITTVVTVSTMKDNGSTIIAAMVGVTVVSILVFVGFAYLSGLIARMKPASAAMMARLVDRPGHPRTLPTNVDLEAWARSNR